MLPSVLWLSRHRPLTTQIEALRKLYGRAVRIVRRDPHHPSGTYMSASDIQRMIDETQCVDVVLVAPYSVIHALVKLGVHPLYAVMDGPPPRKFVKFQRVQGYTFDLCDPKPNKAKEKACSPSSLSV